MASKGLDPADVRTREMIQKTILATISRLEAVERIEIGGNAAACLAAVARRGAPGDIVASRAFAVRANRSSVRVGSAEIAEHGPGIRVRQPQNSLEADRAGGGGEEEVLGHDRASVALIKDTLSFMAPLFSQKGNGYVIFRTNSLREKHGFQEWMGGTRQTVLQGRTEAAGCDL